MSLTPVSSSENTASSAVLSSNSLQSLSKPNMRRRKRYEDLAACRSPSRMLHTHTEVSRLVASSPCTSASKRIRSLNTVKPDRVKNHHVHFLGLFDETDDHEQLHKHLAALEKQNEPLFHVLYAMHRQNMAEAKKIQDLIIRKLNASIHQTQPVLQIAQNDATQDEADKVVAQAVQSQQLTHPELDYPLPQRKETCGRVEYNIATINEMKSFRNVHHEFMVGTQLQTPAGIVKIESLCNVEKNHQTTWRTENVIRKNFQRRLKIMRFIEIEWEKMKEQYETITVDEVIRQLDARIESGELGKTLNEFVDKKLPELNVLEKGAKVVLQHFLPSK